MPKAASSVKPAQIPASYEAAEQELALIVARLESGELALADLQTAHARGTELLAYCSSQLKAVEDQIKVFDPPNVRPWTPE
ncbi:MAG: hypothetical protein RLZZ126_1855 [Pseudomonadota bacterium]|jgi:exodeoxyribonuclease VII small subunit